MKHTMAENPKSDNKGQTVLSVQSKHSSSVSSSSTSSSSERTTFYLEQSAGAESALSPSSPNDTSETTSSSRSSVQTTSQISRSSSTSASSTVIRSVTDTSQPVTLDVPGKMSPTTDYRKSASTECLLPPPVLRTRANSDSGKFSITALPATNLVATDSQKSEDDGEIRYIDEDVDDLNDGEIVVVCQRSESHSTETTSTATVIKETSTKGLSREEIMSRFEEQERSFRESFLSPCVLELSMKKEEELQTRSPLSPDVVSVEKQTVDRNLHYLVKVLQQMTLLRQQNEQLKKRCLFLEDTRYIMQLQNDILVSKDHKSSQKIGQKIMNYFDVGVSNFSNISVRSVSPGRPRWERMPSDGSDIIRSSTPQENGGTPLQRSQSEGSLDLIDLEFSSSTSKKEHSITSYQKSSTMREHFISRTDFHKKSRKLQQKWERVKKVFSSKPEMGVKTETGAVSAEQLVRANTKKYTDKHRPPDLKDLPQHGDDIQGSAVSRLADTGNLHDLPPTPNSVHSEPSTVHGLDDDNDFDHDIIVPVLKRSRSASSVHSENKSGSCHFTFDDPSRKDSSIDKIRYLRQEGLLERRRSSPTISVHEHDRDLMSLEHGRMPRSSSVKFVKSSSDLDLKSLKAAKSDTAAKAKAAWDRVKDIIHTRKDSLKKPGKAWSSGLNTSSDGEVSPDGVFSGEKMFQVGDQDDPLVSNTESERKKARSFSPTGTTPVRVRTMKVGGRQSSETKQKRKSIAHVMLSSSPTDMAAFMGITEDFNKRMQAWEEKKKVGLVKANSFSCEIDPHKSMDSNASTKFTEDFIKKMEEWEQIKGLASPPKSPDPEKLKLKEVVAASERLSPVDITQPQAHPALKHLSESFSKTVQEWERVKERRAQEGTSPGPESRSRQRTVERSKSRERDRSRHKYEKEIQKIERKELKIEREKQKLERMKLKLDMAMESSSGSEGFGDSLAYENMLKQLQDRDAGRATLGQHASETRAMASQFQESLLASYDDGTTNRSTMASKEFVDAKYFQQEQLSPPTYVRPIPQRAVPVVDQGDSHMDRFKTIASLLEPSQWSTPGTTTDQSDASTPQKQLNSNNASDDNTRSLMKDLEDKDEQVKDLQYDIQQLTDRISQMDREHNQKIESYKRQLKAAQKMSQYTCQMYQIDSSLRELRNQVEALIQAQDILVKEKQVLERKHKASVLDQEETKRQLLDQIQNLQEKLDQREKLREMNGGPRPAVTALCGLVTQAQGQLNHLRHALENRSQTIKELERHLLIQRVNNKLLEAGIQRQALEIGYLRQQNKKKIIKRSKTFAGHELCFGQNGRTDPKQSSKLSEHEKKYSLSKRQQTAPSVEEHNADVMNLDLHSNWLEVINRQLEEEEAVPKPSSPQVSKHKAPVKTSGSQTVMTLVSCPYITVNLHASKEKADKTDSSTQSEAKVSKIAAIQTDPLQLPDDPGPKSRRSRTSTDKVIRIIAKVTDPSVPEITPTCYIIAKPGILKSSIPRPKGTETTTTAASLIASPKTRHRSVGTPASPLESSRRIFSNQERAKRPPRLTETWRTLSLDAPTGSDPESSLDTTTTTSSEAASSGGSTKTADSGAQGVGKTLLSPEELTEPQLPCSPVIRSKNLRMLKNSESRAGGGMTTDTNARTWKATPPRRFIRHRKNMVERLSMGSMLGVEDTKDSSTEVVDPRLRSKSDSSELQAACAIARENSFKRKELEQAKLLKTGEHISRMQNILEVRSLSGRTRSSSGVRNIINQYEEGSVNRSGNMFRKSPSPSVPRFSVTSPRRLKTAAELLQDSMEQRSQSTPQTPTEKCALGSPRQKLASTSSDKENSSRTSPKGPVRQSALDSPLLSSRSGVKPTLLSLAISLQHGDSSRQLSDSQELAAKPLKDRTNDSVSGLSDAEQGGGSETPPADQQDPGVKVQRPTAARLSALTPPVSKRFPVRSLARTEPSAAGAVSPKVKPESPLIAKADRSSFISKAGSLDSSQSAWSSDREECPATHPDTPSTKGKKVSTLNPETERKSRSISKGRFWTKEQFEKLKAKGKSPHGFFDRKRTVSPSPARGAISALCMQSMTVSVDDEHPDSPTTTPTSPVVSKDTVPPSPGSDPGDKRSRRGKFLDSNWFQKPKGLFKASKC